ncbi:HAD hydrolase family protein [Kitasatospora cineracea]|uniref:HAD hydrolase family protein n=1 Tax=Kitasatospora cineracea TaxID=88074 RepID=UPI00382B2364
MTARPISSAEPVTGPVAGAVAVPVAGPTDPHATVAELAGQLAGAARAGDPLDAFLYAAGMVQAAEDRLAGTWTAPRRLARHLRDRSGPPTAPPAGPPADPLGSALDGAVRLAVRTPVLHKAVRWTRDLADATDELAALVLDAAPLPSALYRRLFRLVERFDAAPVLRRTLGPAVRRPPSCFCSFDQYPADLAELARRFDAARPLPAGLPLLVVGVRTSGSYLGPLLAAALRRAGHRAVAGCTVRPGQAVLPGRERELARLLAAGGQALVVDDPPVTGRSLAEVAAGLCGRGFPVDAVSVLVAVEQEPPPLGPYRVVALARPDWEVDRLTSPGAVRALVRAAVPGAADWPRMEVGPARSPGRGLHRAVPVTGHPADGPPVPLRVETVGLGHLGRRAAEYAALLPGLVPEVRYLGNGLMIRQDIPAAAPVRALDAARYVAARQRALAVGDDRSVRLVGRGPVWEEAGRLFAPLFGRGAVVLRPLLADPMTRALTRAARPYVVDGRTGAERWAGRDGRWVKTDWAEGAFSHLDLAGYDPAWDLAGLAVAPPHQAGSADEDAGARYGATDEDAGARYGAEVRSGYERLTGERIDPARWCLARLVQVQAQRGVAERPPDRWERRRASARAVQEFLAEVYLRDLPAAPTGADGPGAGWCVLDLDGVLETDPLGFPASSPLGALALRALRAHGFRPLLATGRSLPEVQDRCRAYGLTGGVAEYGAVLHLPGRPPVPLADRDGSEVRAAAGELDGLVADPLARWTARVSRRHPDGRYTGLDRRTADRIAAATGTGVVRGEQQTDFLPPGVGKAAGVRALLAELGDPGAVPVFAAGDGPADRELLRWARLGTAPAHAAPEAKSVARVSSSRYQAGLAEAVATLLGHRPSTCPRCRPPRPSTESRALLALLALPEAGPPGLPARLLRLACRSGELAICGGGRRTG